MDHLHAKGDLDALLKSLARFSEAVLVLLAGKSQVDARAQKIGPSLIFERLWSQLGIKKVITELLATRKFEFNVERAIFLTVLNRLFMSGSDRSCDKWHREYLIEGVDEVGLHHLYRAMAFLGEEIEDHDNTLPLSPRCVKDLIEENLFQERRDLFTGLDFVFFDTTSIYFEGSGGQTLGRKGHSKDRRSELNQMLVGAVLDNNGKPLCCEMWQGNTADITTFIPVTNRIRKRFHLGQFCIIADRGMISSKTMGELEGRHIPYILGARMRKVNEIEGDVLSRGGRYREVSPEGRFSKDPAPLKVKDVTVDDRRYIVCLNTKQARKDAADRRIIIDALKEKLKTSPKALVGNKGYRRYLRLTRGQLSIDEKKIAGEERFDGKWVLTTNTALSAEEVALKYKEL